MFIEDPRKLLKGLFDKFMWNVVEVSEKMAWMRQYWTLEEMSNYMDNTNFGPPLEYTYTGPSASYTGSSEPKFDHVSGGDMLPNVLKSMDEDPSPRLMHLYAQICNKLNGLDYTAQGHLRELDSLCETASQSEECFEQYKKMAKKLEETKQLCATTLKETLEHYLSKIRRLERENHFLQEQAWNQLGINLESKMVIKEDGMQEN